MELRIESYTTTKRSLANHGDVLEDDARIVPLPIRREFSKESLTGDAGGGRSTAPCQSLFLNTLNGEELGFKATVYIKDEGGEGGTQSISTILVFIHFFGSPVAHGLARTMSVFEVRGSQRVHTTHIHKEREAGEVELTVRDERARFLGLSAC